MDMGLRIERTRGALVESTHRVAVAVTDADGRLLASSGDPAAVTWCRSAVKPFQALPLLLDGAAARFQLDDEELALACASHSSEPRHLEVVTRLLARLGLREDQLACGPHPPLSAAVARAAARANLTLTPRWSNCSGKHAGMLALALHHGWPTAGYETAAHPVQQRILRELAAWAGLPDSAIPLAVDGCTAVCFALPLEALARAYARLARSADPAARRIAGVMMGHPFLVAGTGRLCTDLMAAWPGRLLAKIGAEGVYAAALPAEGLGIALKVEDGDMRAAGVALLAVLQQVLPRLAPDAGLTVDTPELTRHGTQPIRNTRDAVTGEQRAAGSLRFSAP